MHSLTVGTFELRMLPLNMKVFENHKRRLKNLALFFGADPHLVVEAFTEVCLTREREYLLTRLVRGFYGGFLRRFPLLSFDLHRSPMQSTLIELPFAFRSRIRLESDLSETNRQPFWTDNWTSLGLDPWAGHVGIPERLYKNWKDAVEDCLSLRPVFGVMKKEKLKWQRFAEQCRQADEELLEHHAGLIRILPSELVCSHLPEDAMPEFSKLTGLTFNEKGLRTDRPAEFDFPGRLRSDDGTDRRRSRLAALDQEAARLILVNGLDDPAVVEDEDFLSDRDVLRLRRFLRTVGIATELMPSEPDEKDIPCMRRLTANAEVIRRVCAQRA